MGGERLSESTGNGEAVKETEGEGRREERGERREERGERTTGKVR